MDETLFQVVDSYLPICLAALSCLACLLTLFTYLKQRNLWSNINSSYLLVICGEFVFTLFYGVQMFPSLHNPALCNVFFFLTQFGLNVQFYAYFFLTSIFIINFYRSKMANFSMCNGLIVIMAIFQTVIADQIFVPQFYDTNICFMQGSGPLVVLLGEQALLFLGALWLTCLNKCKGMQQFHTQFLEDYDQHFIKSKENKMKAYQRIFQYFLVSFLLSLLILALYMVEPVSVQAQEVCHALVNILLSSMPLVAFFFRKKYMYTRLSALPDVSLNDTTLDINNVSVSTQEHTALNSDRLLDFLLLHFFPRLSRACPPLEAFSMHQTRLLSHFQVDVDGSLSQKEPAIREYLHKHPLGLHFYSYAEMAFRSMSSQRDLQNSAVLQECFDMASPLLAPFLSRRLPSDQYSSTFSQGKLKVLFISQKKQEMFVEKFLPEYHQHVHQLKGQSFLTPWLALYSACSRDLAFKRSVALLQTSPRSLFKKQPDLPLLQVEYFKNRVDFIKYHRDGSLLKEERHSLQEFKLKRILSLEMNTKLRLMEQLTRDIEFLMESQVYDYKVTLYYYELTQEIRKQKEEEPQEGGVSMQLPSYKQPLLRGSSSNSKLKASRPMRQEGNYFPTLYGNYYCEVGITNYLSIRDDLTDFEREKNKVQSYSTRVYLKIKDDL